MRTFLSVLSITIGVASLIVLVSLVEGIRFDIEDTFSSAQGARVLPVNSNSPIFSFLDESWVGKIERVKGVDYAVPNIVQFARDVDGSPVSFGGVRVLGVGISKRANVSSSGFDGEILEGRDFVVADDGKKVAIIGLKIKEDYSKFLGSTIKVNGVALKIVGVYSTGSDFLDNAVLVPLSVAREITGFPKDKISYINVLVSNPKYDQVVVDRINLMYGGEIKASSLNDFSSQFGQVFDNVSSLVLVIASVASIVAALVVMNTVLMSVLERFKEIGALKAVGWSNDDVIKMILYESGLIGVFGGFFGVVLGFFATMVLNFFGLTTFVSLELVVGSFFGAFLVGMLSGFYPAFVASRMNPVDALRVE